MWPGRSGSAAAPLGSVVITYSQKWVPRMLSVVARSSSIGCSVTTRCSQETPRPSVPSRSSTVGKRAGSSRRSNRAAGPRRWSSQEIGSGTAPSGQSRVGHRRWQKTRQSQAMWETCLRMDHHIHSRSGWRSWRSSWASSRPATSAAVQASQVRVVGHGARGDVEGHLDDGGVDGRHGGEVRRAAPGGRWPPRPPEPGRPRGGDRAVPATNDAWLTISSSPNPVVTSS